MEHLPNKEYFRKYRSNTLASTSNNYMLIFEEEKIITGRIYYKVRKSGKFNYRFLFSDLVDSTFADGRVSRANLSGDGYEILSAYAGACENLDNQWNAEDCLTPVCFAGKTTKTAENGEVYWSDETVLDIPENHYLVFEWTVRGTRMAYTPDKLIPAFVKDADGQFVRSCEFPQPQLIGCDAESEKMLAFIGDSITMGCGTSVDKYRFWAARIGEGLGDAYSVCNVGLGYGRGQDAATCGIWLEKAKQYEIVVVCLGVNDLLQGRSAEQLKANLTTIVDALNEAGCEVCLFTVPAFNWEGNLRAAWDDVNAYIQQTLVPRTKYWFDMASSSGDPANRYSAMDVRNAHPTDDGCAKIAEDFLKKYPAL